MRPPAGCGGSAGATSTSRSAPRCPGWRRSRPPASGFSFVTCQPAAPGVASSFNPRCPRSARVAARAAKPRRPTARAPAAWVATRPARPAFALELGVPGDAGRRSPAPAACRRSGRRRALRRSGALRRSAKGCGPSAASCTRQVRNARRGDARPRPSAASRRCGDRRVPAARAGAWPSASSVTRWPGARRGRCAARWPTRPVAARARAGRASLAASRPAASASSTPTRESEQLRSHRLHHGDGLPRPSTGPAPRPRTTRTHRRRSCRRHRSRCVQTRAGAGHRAPRPRSSATGVAARRSSCVRWMRQPSRENNRRPGAACASAADAAQHQHALAIGEARDRQESAPQNVARLRWIVMQRAAPPTPARPLDVAPLAARGAGEQRQRRGQRQQQHGKRRPVAPPEFSSVSCRTPVSSCMTTAAHTSASAIRPMPLCIEAASLRARLRAPPAGCCAARCRRARSRRSTAGGGEHAVAQREQPCHRAGAEPGHPGHLHARAGRVDDHQPPCTSMAVPLRSAARLYELVAATHTGLRGDHAQRVAAVVLAAKRSRAARAAIRSSQRGARRVSGQPGHQCCPERQRGEQRAEKRRRDQQRGVGQQRERHARGQPAGVRCDAQRVAAQAQQHQQRGQCGQAERCVGAVLHARRHPRAVRPQRSRHRANQSRPAPDGWAGRRWSRRRRCSPVAPFGQRRATSASTTSSDSHAPAQGVLGTAAPTSPPSPPTSCSALRQRL